MRRRVAALMQRLLQLLLAHRRAEFYGVAFDHLDWCVYIGDMPPREKCRMTLKNGKPCPYRATANGLCGHHLRSSLKQKKKNVEKLLKLGQYASAITAIGKILSELPTLYQSLSGIGKHLLHLIHLGMAGVNVGVTEVDNKEAFPQLNLVVYDLVTDTPAQPTIEDAIKCFDLLSEELRKIGID